MSRLLGVWGTGGCGRGVLPLVRATLGTEDRLVWIDDAAEGIVNGHEVWTLDRFVACPANERRVALAVADGSVRRRLALRCREAGVEPLTVRSPDVVTMDDVDVGEGALISPGVVFTSNIRVGRHFHANLHSIIEHDATIGDFVTFAPGVRCNGNVTIRDDAYLGAGALIRQGLTIGQGATVGMGAVVTKDVPAGVMVVGNPARPLVRPSAP